MNKPMHNLLYEFGLESLPKEEQDLLNAEIGEVVLFGVMRRVWDALDFHQQDALSSLLKECEEDSDNETKQNTLAKFLDEQVPDFSKYVDDECLALRQAQKEALGATQ